MGQARHNLPKELQLLAVLRTTSKGSSAPDQNQTLAYGPRIKEPSDHHEWSPEGLMSDLDVR
ncbi:hypothetical protein SFRURICE_014680, partial [Spodoptera frugiperda]